MKFNIGKYVYSVVFQLSLSMIVALLTLYQLHVLADTLNSEVLGALSLVTVMISFCQNLSEAGLGSYVLHKQELTYETIDSSLYASWFIGVAVSILSIFLGFLIFYFYKVNISISCGYIISVGLLFSSPCAAFQGFLLKLEKVNAVAIVEFFNKFLVLFFSVILLKFSSLAVYSIPIALSLSYIIKLLAYLLLSLKNDIHIIPKVFNLSEILKVAQFSSAQVSSQIVNTVTSKIDEIFIGKFFGLPVLGVYSIFKNLILQVSGLILPISRRLFMPLFSNSRRNEAEKHKLLVISHACFLVFTASCFGLFLIFPDLFIKSIFNEDLLQHSMLLSLLALTWFFRMSAGCIQTACIQILGMPWLEFKWNIFLCVLAIVLIFIVSFFKLSLYHLVSLFCLIYFWMFIYSFRFFYKEHFNRSFIAKLRLVSAVLSGGCFVVSAFYALLRYRLIIFGYDDLLIYFIEFVFYFLIQISVMFLFVIFLNKLIFKGKIYE